MFMLIEIGSTVQESTAFKCNTYRSHKDLEGILYPLDEAL